MNEKPHNLAIHQNKVFRKNVKQIRKTCKAVCEFLCNFAHRYETNFYIKPADGGHGPARGSMLR